MDTLDETQDAQREAAQADPTLALSRRGMPPLPPAVADLWQDWGYAGGTTPEQVRVALDGVTSIVNAMAGGERFSVRMGGTGTGATNLKAHAVNITSAALKDERLTLMERLAVTTGMALHEAGHGRITGPMDRAMRRAYGDDPSNQRTALAHRLSNIAEDVRLERQTTRDWPAYGDLFPLVMWWVAQRFPTGLIDRMPESQPQAVNLGLAAIRYGDLAKWAGGADVAAERQWWVDWAERIAATDKPKDHVAMVGEALDHIAHLPMVAPAPPQPAPSAPNPESDEDEDGQDQPGDEDVAGPEAEDEDADEDGEGDEPGEDEADEADDWSDDDADADDAGSDESEDDEDIDAEGLPGGADDGDQDADADDSESDEDEDADGDGGSAEADDTDADEAEDADESEDWGDDADEDGDGEDEVDVYHRTDEAEASRDGDERDEDGEDITFGEAEDKDWTGEREDTEDQRPTQDALDQPLALHGEDAATDDDRLLDAQVGAVLRAEAVAADKESVMVTHKGGQRVRVGIYRSNKEGTKVWTSPEVQGSLRAAFTQRRVNRDNRAVARSGRLSPSRAFRVAAGFDNVFTRRDSISPDRLDVHLLVDASGSMMGDRVRQATVMVANMAEALERLPYVRVHVWSHNTDYGTTVREHYDSRTDKIRRIGGIRAGSANNDASAIMGVVTRIVRERSARERSVLVVLSDGAPCEDVEWVRGAVESAEQKGIGMVSVAVAGGLTATQEACYGATNVVPWEGDWDRLARGIAQIIGRKA